MCLRLVSLFLYSSARPPCSSARHTLISYAPMLSPVSWSLSAAASQRDSRESRKRTLRRSASFRRGQLSRRAQGGGR